MSVDPAIFQAGIPAVIQIQGYSKLKMTTFFRGFRSNQYLILDHPINNGRPISISENTQCIVRFIHEGMVVGFKTEVQAQIRFPAPLVFLNYPLTVETSVLRKNERYPVDIEAVVSTRKLEGDVDSVPRSRLLNLSKGGCLLETSDPIDIGSFVFLSVFLPEQGRIDDIETEVKRNDRKDRMFMLGLAFTDFMSPSFEQINGFLHMLEVFQVRT